MRDPLRSIYVTGARTVGGRQRLTLVCAQAECGWMGASEISVAAIVAMAGDHAAQHVSARGWHSKPGTDHDHP